MQNENSGRDKATGNQVLGDPPALASSRLNVTRSVTVFEGTGYTVLRSFYVPTVGSFFLLLSSMCLDDLYILYSATGNRTKGDPTHHYGCTPLDQTMQPPTGGKPLPSH